MTNKQLTIDQIEQLNQISDPVARRRYSILFQLPQDMQDAFESENTTNSVWSIIKEKYGLSDRHTGITARIIGLIFLGELPIKNFIVSLQRDLGVDLKTAQSIAQDINQAIFQPVRQSLMAVHGIVESTPAQIQTQAPVQQKQKTQYIQPQQKIPQDDYEAKRRREEVLNKIKQPPAPAKPAMLRLIPNKNVVDLRVLAKKHYKKSEYDGFFSA